MELLLEDCHLLFIIYCNSVSVGGGKILDRSDTNPSFQVLFVDM